MQHDLNLVTVEILSRQPMCIGAALAFMNKCTKIFNNLFNEQGR